MIACPNPDCAEHGIEKQVWPGVELVPPVWCGACGTEIDVDPDDLKGAEP